jgi:hypothetical protein
MGPCWNEMTKCDPIKPFSFHAASPKNHIIDISIIVVKCNRPLPLIGRHWGRPIMIGDILRSPGWQAQNSHRGVIGVTCASSPKQDFCCDAQEEELGCLLDESRGTHT